MWRSTIGVRQVLSVIWVNKFKYSSHKSCHDHYVWLNGYIRFSCLFLFGPMRRLHSVAAAAVVAMYTDVMRHIVWRRQQTSCCCCYSILNSLEFDLTYSEQTLAEEIQLKRWR